MSCAHVSNAAAASSARVCARALPAGPAAGAVAPGAVTVERSSRAREKERARQTEGAAAGRAGLWRARDRVHACASSRAQRRAGRTAAGGGSCLLAGGGLPLGADTSARARCFGPDAPRPRPATASPPADSSSPRPRPRSYRGAAAGTGTI